LNIKILRRSLIGLGIAALFGLIIYSALYAFIRNSNAYSCAENYIDQSSAIKSEFGGIKKISLALDSFTYKSDGADGKSTMTINITGETKEGSIVFYLRQESGKWMVAKTEALSHP